jgi:hypothetical protein
VGSRGHADHLDDPQQRHHKEPARLAVAAVRQAVAPARAARAGVGSGVVHVPDQHRSHGAQVRVLGGRR